MKMLKSVFLIATAFTLAGASGLFAAANVNEEVLAPASAGFQYFVGPDGLHVAAVGNKGSRRIVLLDNVAGPKLDSIVGNILFSADGRHCAYAGMVGEEYLVVLDGKELTRVAKKLVGTSGVQLHFSPAGKHLYFCEAYDETGQDGNRLVMDAGTPGPLCSDQPVPVFSADDAHWVYVDAERMNHHNVFMVVDNLRVPFMGNIVQYAGNRLLLMQKTATGQQLLLAGKELVSGQAVSVWGVSPDGNLVVSTVDGQLYVNDKAVPGTKLMSVDKVFFSDDGRHYATVCLTDHNTKYVVFDGKRGDEYSGIYTADPTVCISPDGSTCAYVGFNGGQQFVVSNDFESDGDRAVRHLEQAGRSGRFAYITEDQGNKLYVDGKLAGVGTFGIQSFAFSEDGSRYAFVANPPGKTDIDVLYIDGKPVENFIAKPLGWIAPTSAPRHQTRCVISPDGKHIAYFGTLKNNRKESGLWVDGKLVYTNAGAGWRGLVYQPAFTADSKHLYWVAAGKTSADRVLYLDGAPVKEFTDANFQHLDGGWEVDSDGTLRFIAVAADMIKRYTIKPTAETSVAGMLSGTGGAKPGVSQNSSDSTRGLRTASAVAQRVGDSAAVMLRTPHRAPQA